MRFLKFVYDIYVLSLYGTPVNLLFQEHVSKHLVKKNRRLAFRRVKHFKASIDYKLISTIIIIIIIIIIDSNLNLFSLLTF
jgi:hypothetical protein